MKDTLIDKPVVVARLLQWGVRTESMETPSRIPAPIAAAATYENEIVDWRQPGRLEPANLIQRASDLGKLEKGWNSYSAPAPTPATIGNAKTLLTLASVAGVVPERIEPSAMGGVGVTFTAGSREVAVEFYNAGNAHALFSDKDTEALDTALVVLGVAGYNRLLQEIRRYLYGRNAAAHAP